MTAVTARDVRKSFGTLEVLRGVTLELQPGERLVLLGRSGSGKSTFLRCLNGLERIDGGQLDVLGIDLASPHPDLRTLRRRVGIVFQGFNLFPHLAPSLMLFDEITSALDPELIGEVVNVLLRLAEQDIGMVIVTHQLGFARSIASRLAFMHEGRIHEDGRADEVLGNPRTAEFRAFLSAVLT